MKKIRAAVVGYGNIGKYTIQALEAAPDFEIAGVVRRNGAADKPIELTPYEVVKDIKELKDVDVAILATPTRSCEDYAKQIVPLGINTVDSFDIHTQIRGYRERQMELNKQTGTVSVIAAGWDPGSDSIVRTLMQSLAPKGLSYTNFGPGMSMGHSVCYGENIRFNVKTIDLLENLKGTMMKNIVITMRDDDLGNVDFLKQYLGAQGDNRCDLYFRMKDQISGNYVMLRSKKPIAVDKRLLESMREAGIKFRVNARI